MNPIIPLYGQFEEQMLAVNVTYIVYYVTLFTQAEKSVTWSSSDTLFQNLDLNLGPFASAP